MTTSAPIKRARRPVIEPSFGVPTIVSIPFGFKTRRHADNEWFPMQSKKRSVVFAALGGILLGIVDDPVRADGPHHAPAFSYCTRRSQSRQTPWRFAPRTYRRRPPRRSPELCAPAEFVPCRGRPCRAVRAATGAAAACSKVTLSGFRTNADFSPTRIAKSHTRQTPQRTCRTPHRPV